MSSLDNSELSQLKWRCRRGIKELDVVLCLFLEEYYFLEEYDEKHSDDKNSDVNSDVNSNEKKALKAAFKELLSLEDPVLYAMLLGRIVPADSEQCKVIDSLRNLNLASN